MSKSSQTPPPPHLNVKSNPAVLLIIVILALVFFISGLLHLLARFITRNRSSSSSSSGSSSTSRSRLSDLQNPETYQIQSQLQQLFNLHDSGLDQAFIDALPLFNYKDIKGLHEPYDCAVCLTQFLEDDELRLLPLCSHAFHIDCIDTWLLSNSTCPLCRGSLYPPDLTIHNPVFEFENWTQQGIRTGTGTGTGVSPNEVVEEIADEKKMVLPIKLGKFKASNLQPQDGVEPSSSNLDGRRCFSMGSYQYLVVDSELQVALSSNRVANGGIGRGRVINGDVKGKKINMGSKNESFSVSKIWLWSSTNPKFPASSPNTHIGNHPGFDLS